MSEAAITQNDKAAAANDVNLEAAIMVGNWDEAELEVEKAKRAAFMRRNDPKPCWTVPNSP